MSYRLEPIRCWICGQPYQPKRPENKVHRACEDARRRQAAAEDAHYAAPKRRREIRIDISDEDAAAFEEALDELFSPRERGAAASIPVSRTGDVGSSPADPAIPLKILIIPDTQVKPGVPTEHMTWLGKYAAQKRPDVIVHLGDHWDMPSLSSYDVGKKSYEGRRYVDDIDAGNAALDLFDSEIARVDGYEPRKVFLIGNHEQRIERAIEGDRKLEGLIGYHHFNLGQNGWEVHDFLEIVEIAGIEFSHYFCVGAYNKPVSSAAALLRERQNSAIQGHNQIWQVATHPRTHATAIFAGAFYQHIEKFLTPQGSDHRRQVLMLHEAKDGIFDLMQVSLDFLRRRFS